MDRRGFLKLLGFGAVASHIPLPTLPTVAAEAAPVTVAASTFATNLPALYLARLSFLDDVLFDEVPIAGPWMGKEYTVKDYAADWHWDDYDE